MIADAFDHVLQPVKRDQLATFQQYVGSLHAFSSTARPSYLNTVPAIPLLGMRHRD